MASASGADDDEQLIVLSARSASALDDATSSLRDHLVDHPADPLADVAFTLQTGRRRFSHRRAVVARGADEAIARLGALDPATTLTGSSTLEDASVAFLFPGQGAQSVGMARGLYEADPDFRADVDECSAVLRPRLGFDLRDVLYPRAGRRGARGAAARADRGDAARAVRHRVRPGDGVAPPRHRARRHDRPLRRRVRRRVPRRSLHARRRAAARRRTGPADAGAAARGDARGPGERGRGPRAPARRPRDRRRERARPDRRLGRDGRDRGVSRRAWPSAIWQHAGSRRRTRSTPR